MNPSQYTPLTCPQCGGGLPSFDETLTCAYCGTPLLRGRSAGGEPGPVVQGLRMRMLSCPDSGGTGLEAFRLLAPAGWRAQGGVAWRNDNPGSPAALDFRVFDPQGLPAFSVLPHLSLFWSSDAMMRMSFPVGSRYFGNEIRQPVEALRALRELALPRYRPIPGLQVVGEERLPALPGQMRSLNPAAAGAAPQADGARVTIRYAEGGQAAEEEIYGVTEYNVQNAPGMFGPVQTVFWTLDYMTAFRAEAGKLEASRAVFQAMLGSFRLNPEWFGRVVQMSQHLIGNQIQQIQNIGQLSRYISQVNNQISDTITRGYEQRQGTLDRIHQQFSQSIRGVEAYYDPNQGREVELPGGYRYAWANALGEYIVSDSATLNPNVGSNLGWTEMGRA